MGISKKTLPVILISFFGWIVFTLIESHDLIGLDSTFQRVIFWVFFLQQSQGGGAYSDVAGAVATTNVAFITTGTSASASELVPNVLEPYRGPSGPPGTALGLVGAKTYGKPVGQRGFRLANCDTVAYVVAFRLQNQQGDGGYYDGLPDAAGKFSGPLCAAEDDLAHAPGTDAEASTAAALTFVETGACPVAPAPAAKLGIAAARAPDVYPVAPEPSLAQRNLSGFF